MNQLLFTGGRFLDPTKDELMEGVNVLVDGERIKEVSDRPIQSSGAERIDLRGRTLMPGLIDCHCHIVYAVAAGSGVENAMAPNSLAALRAARLMRAMLWRGFTTIRDTCGADYGFVLAREEGLVEGPRLVICGKALSQLGGHGDIRGRSDNSNRTFEDRVGAVTRVVDGVDNVRRAVREEIKAGANFIKIMASGGVCSPTDPIHALGYSRDEVLAIVEEAQNAGTYVAAHLYEDRAIRRAVECGVHSLEHCNLIQSATATLAARAGCIAVPNLIAYEALALEGKRYGLTPESCAKIETVRGAGMNSLEIMHSAGLPMAFGSDLVGELQKYQCNEWEIRARVLPIPEIIRSATLVGAKLCRKEGEIGIIAPGAYADLLVVDGDPYRDIRVLQNDGAHIQCIIQGGRFIKSQLA